MRLLITTDTVGGVWTFTSELTQQLLQRGHFVHLVSFGRDPSAEQLAFFQDRRARYPEHFDYTASSFPLEWMQNNERAYNDGAKLLESVIRNVARPELVLSNQFCFGALPDSTPRIVVAHSDVLSWAKACRPSALEPTPWLNRYTSMVQAGLLSASAVVAPTTVVGRSLLKNFFLPHNFVVIPNGGAACPVTDDTPERKLQAITAGRLWDEAKGLDTLKGLSSPMPLLVAGDNSFEDGDPQAAWPALIQNLGALDQRNLHWRFRESALYICTSRYEPFGLAPLEAALCGCAIVARDLPSLREVWVDNALYFTDDTSLTDILYSLRNNRNLLAQYQARAKERAKFFTPERMTDSYLALFQSVLQQSQAMQHVA